MKRILIVDDEKNIRLSLSNFLKIEGFETFESEDGEHALKLLDNEEIDIVILDLIMPGMDGMEVLKLIKQKHESIPVIMLTAHGNTERAVQAIKQGAYDFLDKPPNTDKLIVCIKNALDMKQLIEEKTELEIVSFGKEKLIGESAVMKELYQQIDRVAPLNTRVLIIGESGTGKELIAMAIHKKSKRKDKRFVKVNCAAIPSELFESEFFGHEKGAFTGAITKKIGKFEKADGGTLFLDEVGDIPLSLQPKILRAIQYGEIQRIGCDKETYVDVRLIAATNKDLEKCVKEGTFREDLFYRLNVFPIYVPPLREHKDDIPLLVNHFVKQISIENNFRPPVIEPNAMDALLNYDYPGNIRELKNILERVMILHAGENITNEHIEKILGYKSKTELNKNLKNTILNAERKAIIDALEKFNWNMTKTAKFLGIERSHLYKKMHKLNISKTEDR
jgi:two-component system response regulator AtoC